MMGGGLKVTLRINHLNHVNHVNHLNHVNHVNHANHANHVNHHCDRGPFNSTSPENSAFISYGMICLTRAVQRLKRLNVGYRNYWPLSFTIILQTTYTPLLFLFCVECVNKRKTKETWTLRTGEILLSAKRMHTIKSRMVELIVWDDNKIVPNHLLNR